MGTAATTAKAGMKTKRPVAKQVASTGAAKVATVTVGELRSNFKAVEAKLAKGLRVQVTRRGEVVAEVQAPAHVVNGEAPVKKGWLEFLEERTARMREIWGDQPVNIDTTALISEGRDRDFLL